ncbi:MAG: hypothetical protein DMF83_29805 [Acidobacteria bacterium]|nr:MAG: hypothetical protein DMF83_29805 [Acidobacteriota bacterium]
MIGRWTAPLASLALAASVGLTGCAAIRRSQSLDTEQFLAAAGFRMELADTAERWQQLAAMPPHRLTSRARGDGIEYAYADPRDCHCVYVGGPKDYAEYQRLTRERQIAQEEIWTWQNPWSWGGPWW